MQRVPQLRTALQRSLRPAARTLATSSPPALAPRVAAALSSRSTLRALLPVSGIQSRRLHTPPASPADSSSSSGSSSRQADADDTSKVPLTQRIKYLFRKHGWTALVVYLVLSAADFAACFLVISAVGADRVRDAEDWTLDHLGWRRKGDGHDGAEAGKWRRAVDGFRERRAAHHPSGAAAHPSPAGAEAVAAGASSGEVVEADRNERSAYSAYATTAVLAYAVHKTLLLPFRVGLTVAVTPRVVRMLQGWGWKVGMAAGAPPMAKAAAASAAAAAGKAAGP
ncbi:hypothetical protein JCM3770_005013 [Rhodotorula araucariae]